MADEREAELFRFYPFARENSISIADAGVDADEDPLLAYSSYELAKRLMDYDAEMHIAASLSVLYSPKSPRQELLNSLGSRPLFAFAEDAQVVKSFAGLNLQLINYLSEYYSCDSDDKILITASYELMQAIVAQSPAAFIHLLLCEQGWELCLAQELYPRDVGLSFGALRLAEALAYRVEERNALPFAEAKLAISAEKYNSYGFFADRYDEYMSHVDYEEWYHLLRKWQEEYSERECKKALELACGTAAIARLFAMDGVEIHACDASAQMLENAAKRGANIRLYQAAMSDPIPEKDYDLVVCMFDSINYLCDKRLIKRCLEEVYQALAPGGIFIFDISTLGNSLDNFCDDCTLTDEPEGIMVHHAYYEPWTKRQISRLELFENWGEGCYRRSELHRQRVYLASDMVDMIEDSPLELLGVFGREPHVNLYPKKISSADTRYNRLYFVLKKQ